MELSRVTKVFIDSILGWLGPVDFCRFYVVSKWTKKICFYYVTYLYATKSINIEHAYPLRWHRLLYSSIVNRDILWFKYFMAKEQDMHKMNGELPRESIPEIIFMILRSGKTEFFNVLYNLEKNKIHDYYIDHLRIALVKYSRGIPRLTMLSCIKNITIQSELNEDDGTTMMNLMIDAVENNWSYTGDLINSINEICNQTNLAYFIRYFIGGIARSGNEEMCKYIDNFRAIPKLELQGRDIHEVLKCGNHKIIKTIFDRFNFEDFDNKFVVTFSLDYVTFHMVSLLIEYMISRGWTPNYARYLDRMFTNYDKFHSIIIPILSYYNNDNYWLLYALIRDRNDTLYTRYDLDPPNPYESCLMAADHRAQRIVDYYIDVLTQKGMEIPDHPFINARTNKRQRKF